ncbi:MAG: choline-glycine betaine transporter [Porticoccaceae bacterium]|jgi:choline-glycine betaine transporter
MSKAKEILSENAWPRWASLPVLTGSCLIGLLVLTLSALMQSLTSTFLSRVVDFYLAHFPHWIIWSVSFFLIYSAALALLPSIGCRKLGTENDYSKYSFFSWFSMIFGVGMGVGLLTWGVAEPIAGMQNNPDVIRGLTTAWTAENTSSALKWSYAHWGFAGWASYALVGLAVAYTGHRQRLPLTIRTALSPLFGNAMKGVLGHLVDVLTVVVTLFSIIQVLGYALNELVIAVAQTTNAVWLLDSQGNASNSAKIATSALMIFLSAFSAISGIGRGVKWFSNVNMLVSFIFLAIIFLAGSLKDGLLTLFSSVFDYLINLPSMMFQVWMKDGTAVGDNLQAWQGEWSMYHWACWWLAFAPFIGIFLAKISRGRTIRQYVFATVILPTLLTMIWMSWAGGNAIELELSGVANGELISADIGIKIFTLVQLMFESLGAWIVSMTLLFLLITYLVTTIDSAIMVSTSVLRKEHDGTSTSGSILAWSVILTVAMTVLILVDGFSSIRSAVAAASAPISILIAALCLSLTIAIYNDTD